VRIVANIYSTRYFASKAKSQIVRKTIIARNIIDVIRAISFAGPGRGSSISSIRIQIQEEREQN
jgi:hypothetical protein